MNDALEKDLAHTTGQKWYVKIEDGSTFGPVGIDALRVWAETGRIAPGQLISRDRKDWIFAENLPALQMVWRIELDNGAMYGPVNLQAVRSLVEEGIVSRKAVLFNELTHRKSAVAKEFDAMSGKPSRSARSSAAPDAKSSAQHSGKLGENEALLNNLAQAQSEVEKCRAHIKTLHDCIHESVREISSRHDRLQKERRRVSSELADTRMRLDSVAKAAGALSP